MPELRDLLEQSAGEGPAAVPFEEIKRRSRVLRRRRQAGTAAVASLALAAAVVLATAGQLPKKEAPPAREGPKSIQVVNPRKLDTGRYEDPVFALRVSFEIPEDTVWRAVLVKPSSLVLTSDDSPPTATMALVHWWKVYDLARGRVSTTSTAARPANLIRWLAAHPALRVTAGPTSTELAGRQAEMLTFTLARNLRLPAGPSPDCPDRPSCLALFETRDKPVLVGSRDQMTVITQDNDPSGLVLVLTIHGRAADSVDARLAMDEVVSSLRLDE